MKRAILVAACIAFPTLVSAGPIKSKSPKVESPRPFGLTWGMPITEATAILAERLEAAEDQSEQFPKFTGEFAGFQGVTVEAYNYHDRLEGITIVIPVQGEVYKSTTWREAVGKIQEKYGKPKTITAPPDLMAGTRKMYKLAEKRLGESGQAAAGLAQSVDDLNNSPMMLDHKIETTEWKPDAQWKFPDKSSVRIMSVPEHKLPGTAAMIMFGGPNILKGLAEEDKKQKPDF